MALTGSMEHFEGLRQQLTAYLDAEQIDQVAKAFELARDAHAEQKRSSGEPYITHPVAVAGYLAELRMDAQSLMAALMHDVMEDCGVSKETLQSQFGPQVADLVEGVSKLTQIKFGSKAEQQAENFRKMMMAMTRDIRVILIKLADRLHNMRTLESLAPPKRRRIAQETLDIYAPIANRLGIYQIKSELEDLGFAALYPFRYQVLRNAVKKARGNRKEIVSGIAQAIENRLKKAGIDCTVIGREKSLFSIYEKMRTRVGSFSEVMDIYGFRIITGSDDHCYRTLGQIHTLYKPVPGRFKDYIAIPKSNGYQSLHTVLKGPHGLHIEVQIRTEQMDGVAAHGVAAHWRYKSNVPSTVEARAREWLRSVIEFQQSAGDSLEFVENVKFDLFPDEVYVFTPNGNILELPAWATPVDFAYAIHTDVGNSCIAAKIDRQLAPLSTPLRNGQTVEIVTAPGARPNPTWLNFVVTGKARANIRHFLKNQRRDDSLAMGKRLLEKALGSKKLTDFSEAELLRVAQDTKHKSFDDLLADIGVGGLPVVTVAHRLDPDRRVIKKDDGDTPNKPLAISGTEGMLVTYARCCCPIPGDPIIGILQAGRGIAVHVHSCPATAEFIKQPERIMPLTWDKDVKGEFAVELEVDVINQRGVLAKLTATIADEEANIANVEIDPRDGSYNTIVFMVQVRGRLHLANIMRRLRAMSEVNRIMRHHRAAGKGVVLTK